MWCRLVWCSGPDVITGGEVTKYNLSFCVISNRELICERLDRGRWRPSSICCCLDGAFPRAKSFGVAGA